jgi:polysaccharide biosynthesis/export protein
MRVLVLLLFSTALYAQIPVVQPASSDVSVNRPVLEIGPNDLIALSTYGSPEFTRTVRVDPHGMIRLPMLKEPIRAAGLTPERLGAAIADALKSADLIVAPFVTVTMAEYQSRSISVAGAVRHPTIFQAERPTTLLDALTRAEGLADDAGQEIVVTYPQTASAGAESGALRVSVKALMSASDPKANLRLMGGEEVRVPQAGRIFVIGNVKKPGQFIVNDDSQNSVLTAVALAEGLDAYASKRAYIYRRSPDGSKTEIPVDLKGILKRKANDVPLMANDILYVPTSQNIRAGLRALDRMAMFGAGAVSAIIYATAR